MSTMDVSGLLNNTVLGSNMNDYQFRTNFIGQLILQRRVVWTNGTTGWQDAKAEDLRDYYAELFQLQAPCTAPQQPGLWDSTAG